MPQLKGTVMKLITVEALFSTDNADKSITLFEDHAPSVRDMAGCRSYDLYTDPKDAGKIVIVQRWDSMSQFDRYRKSDVFTQLGMGLKPMMTAPPVTTICDVAAS